MSKRSEDSDSTPEEKTFTSFMLIIGILVSILSAMAFPETSDKPPKGVKTYRSGDNLTCWDKVVCCNPSDKSTCATIPICEID